MLSPKVMRAGTGNKKFILCGLRDIDTYRIITINKYTATTSPFQIL